MYIISSYCISNHHTLVLFCYILYSISKHFIIWLYKNIICIYIISKNTLHSFLTYNIFHMLATFCSNASKVLGNPPLKWRIESKTLEAERLGFGGGLLVCSLWIFDNFCLEVTRKGCAPISHKPTAPACCQRKLTVWLVGLYFFWFFIERQTDTNGWSSSLSHVWGSFSPHPLKFPKIEC